MRRGGRGRPSRPMMSSHPVEDVVEEEAEPDALAPALRADLVEPVVPVAGAHQREAVDAHPPVEHEVDRPQAVAVDRVLARRPERVEPHPLLAGRQGLERQVGLEVGRPLVEERLVAGRPDVLDDGPGQPEQVVRGVRPADEPGPAVLEAVEPVDDVPFEELLRGVQEDLPARERRGPSRSG